MRSEPGHGVHLSYYDFGRTTVYACQADSRFCYCAYIPENYNEQAENRYALAVVVHGTDRGMTAYREHFVDFAEANDCIVLAPLFPVGIPSEGNLTNYKLIKAGDIRYDRILLAMVEEMAAKYRLEAERFLLYGFSGGGHFAHRFFYLHPKRLAGVSIGAPGVVTLLDPAHDYWVGVRNLEATFGTRLEPEAMRAVPVHMVIGAEDKDRWEITIKPGDAWWMEGAALAGADRQERMHALKASFEAQGIAVRQDVVAGVGHSAAGVVGPVKTFFSEVLRERRKAQAVA